MELFFAKKIRDKVEKIDSIERLYHLVIFTYKHPLGWAYYGKPIGASIFVGFLALYAVSNFLYILIWHDNPLLVILSAFIFFSSSIALSYFNLQYKKITMRALSERLTILIDRELESIVI